MADHGDRGTSCHLIRLYHMTIDKSTTQRDLQVTMKTGNGDNSRATAYKYVRDQPQGVSSSSTGRRVDGEKGHQVCQDCFCFWGKSSYKASELFVFTAVLINHCEIGNFWQYFKEQAPDQVRLLSIR